MADLRIGGLATGMDIDSIVDQLMAAERLPLSKVLREPVRWVSTVKFGLPHQRLAVSVSVPRR